MADTSFIDNVLSASNRIVAAWLNAINNYVYRGINPGYQISGGSANAQTLAFPASLQTTLVDGQVFQFQAGFSNTGPMTLALSFGTPPTAIPAKAVVSPAAAAFTSGVITAGGIYSVAYNAGADKYMIQSASTGSGGATGGGNDRVFYLNDQTVTEDYTLVATQNAISGGPISVAVGKTVTVAVGATWTVPS